MLCMRRNLSSGSRSLHSENEKLRFEKEVPYVPYTITTMIVTNLVLEKPLLLLLENFAIYTFSALLDHS